MNRKLKMCLTALLLLSPAVGCPVTSTGRSQKIAGMDTKEYVTSFGVDLP